MFGRFAAAPLASTSATISSTRPPSLFFRCSIAARPSSRESATKASANGPRAAAIAASKPFWIVMCDATSPRIPRRPAEEISDAPSFCSRVRFSAERFAASESRSRSALCSSSRRLSILEPASDTAFCAASYRFSRVLSDELCWFWFCNSASYSALRAA